MRRVQKKGFIQKNHLHTVMLTVYISPKEVNSGGSPTHNFLNIGAYNIGLYFKQERSPAQEQGPCWTFVK